MKKLIEVRSLTDAKAFSCNAPWAAISVMTFADEHPALDPINLFARLDLEFADIEFNRQSENFKVFDHNDALQILQFVDEVWDKVDCIMVHCAAGMSRSPAVAAAIENITYGSGADNHWFAKKTPNMLVYRTILEAHHGRQN